VRIGVDVGGTKLEVIAIDHDGREVLRRRMATPRGSYEGTLDAIRTLVLEAESEVGPSTVGIGMPGTISPATGLVKNANSTWLNGQPFGRDLMRVLDRELRLANDANCLALSEATDGAAAGASPVFAVILGTGVGGGLAVHGQIVVGVNAIAGEWGHNPVPWPTAGEWRSKALPSATPGSGWSARWGEWIRSRIRSISFARSSRRCSLRPRSASGCGSS